MLPGVPTTLALDPTSDGFCFAVLAGSETLLDWGCREVKPRTRQEWRRKVHKLVSRYDPVRVVLEDANASRRGGWARTFAADIAAFAEESGISVCTVSRAEVQDAFRVSGTTKYEIAVAIARIFPELEPRLPRKRKSWMSEDERMSIFDAISFALVAIRRTESPSSDEYATRLM